MYGSGEFGVFFLASLKRYCDDLAREILSGSGLKIWACMILLHIDGHSGSLFKIESNLNFKSNYLPVKLGF